MPKLFQAFLNQGPLTKLFFFYLSRGKASVERKAFDIGKSSGKRKAFNLWKALGMGNAVDIGESFG